MHQIDAHEQATTAVTFVGGLGGRGLGGGGGDGGGERLLAVSGCKDGAMRLWDVTSAVCIARTQLDGGAGVTAIAAARTAEDDAQLYVGSPSPSLPSFHVPTPPTIP